MTARIGDRRVYPGAEVPILYPGEKMNATIDPAAVLAALERGEREIPITNWLVEPMPGWHGWWLRMRWRIWGRWFGGRGPKLEVSAHAVRED